MNPLERILAPFNTRATSVAGAALVTTSIVGGVHDLTNGDFLLALFTAVRYHTDPTPIAQLAACGIGVLIGCAGLYIGAPWFVGKAPPAA